MSAKPFTDNNHPIVDVRTREEFLAGHLQGACHIALSALANSMHQLPANHVPLNLCGDPESLTKASEFLTSKGYQVLSQLVAEPSLFNRAKELNLFELGANCVSLWQANPLLIEAIEQIESLTPGRKALDLACGAGRDAVFLAKRGWQVRAIDNKADALTRVQQLASSSTVTEPVTTEQLDIELPDNWPQLLTQRYDLIVVMRYCHRPLMSTIKQLLKPEGILLYSTFMVGSEQFGSPKNPAYLLKPNELADTFSELKIIIDQQRTLADGRPISYFVAQHTNNN